MEECKSQPEWVGKRVVGALPACIHDTMQFWMPGQLRDKVQMPAFLLFIVLTCCA